MPKRTRIGQPGTVISGTLRNEDLIPEFIRELRCMVPLHRADRKLIREVEFAMKSPDYWGSEAASEDCNSLMDALSNYAPYGCYFGATVGDGADFGFWLPEYFQQEFDGLQVSDTSEIPTGYTGEVLHVNDHGNATIYACNRGRLRELAAYV